MQYRSLGQTGMNVSVLSIGSSALGGVYHDYDDREGIAAIRTALDLGINLIDSSPFYGLTRAESVLGKALAGVPRDQYFLATKCGRYGHKQEHFDFSAERVTRSVDESLARLGVDYLDIIQAHDIEFGDINQVVDETIPALVKIRETGKVRFVGITGLPVRLLADVVARSPVGAVNTILSYCHYELNDTALLDILPEMEKRGVAVINASPIGMGLLSLRGPPKWHPAPEHVKQTCQQAAAHCQSRGVSIVKLAMQFAVLQRRIPTTLFSTCHAQNVKDNVAWIDEPIDESLLQEVLGILRPIHNVTWPQGRPENN
jgi:L-galactose dehydrogenase